MKWLNTIYLHQHSLNKESFSSKVKDELEEERRKMKIIKEENESKIRNLEEKINLLVTELEK